MTVTCPFCRPEEVILSNSLVYARYDKYPVNKGHLLIIPYRHIADYFDLSKEEKTSIIELVDESKLFLQKELSPDGYNVGVNCGVHAGQTIMHVHVHLIPRYEGDMNDPSGGVRGVIPMRQKYSEMR